MQDTKSTHLIAHDERPCDAKEGRSRRRLHPRSHRRWLRPFGAPLAAIRFQLVALFGREHATCLLPRGAVDFLRFLLLSRVGKRRVRHYLFPFRSRFFMNLLDLTFLVIGKIQSRKRAFAMFVRTGSWLRSCRRSRLVLRTALRKCCWSERTHQQKRPDSENGIYQRFSFHRYFLSCSSVDDLHL